MFDVPEEDLTSSPTMDSNVTVTTSPPLTTTTPTPVSPTPPRDPDAVTCSGRTFDAFMQLKNGSMFAFRGEFRGSMQSLWLFISSRTVFLHKTLFACVPGDYFFELDDRSVMPGYPKLIKDVWGISGPIDAAFTRINCQGKTYIFKVCLLILFSVKEDISLCQLSLVCNVAV